MNSRSLFLLLALFITSAARAQYNFKSGYVISLQGDTLRGYINYQERTRTPVQFLFRSMPDDKTTTPYTVHNARKVVIEGNESYERFEVSISMNEKDYSRLELNAHPLQRTDTVFLAVVSKGDKVNLYAYRDKLKDRFYTLVAPQSTPVELEIREDIQGAQQVATQNLYRQQLYKIAVDNRVYSPELKRIIESASYSKTSLRNIVSRINTVNEEPAHTGIKYRKGVFFAGVGINSSSIVYKGSNILNANGLDKNGNPAYKDETKTSSVLPVVSAGYDLFFHPAVQRSFLRAEIRATAVQSKVSSFYKFPAPYTEELNNSYKLTGVFLSLDPQLGYNFYQRQNLKVYASAGLSVRYSFYPKQTLQQHTNMQGSGYSNKVVDNYFTMRSITATPLVNAGVVLNSKLCASVTWFNKNELRSVHTTTNQSVTYRSLIFSVGYRF